MEPPSGEEPGTGEGASSLDQNANIKRKAQDLVKKGSYAEAAAAYEKMAEAGDMAPYDFVVLGDLLIRNGRRRDAVDRYVEALNSYAEAGLHRNAIALAKKVHRLAPKLNFVHRRLGDLYAAEGLASEACLHYLEFLDKSGRDPEGAEHNGDEAESVEHVCVRLLDLPLPSFDVIDRVVESAKRVERERQLAPGVLGQARRAGSRGEGETESRLAALARELDPELDENAPPRETPSGIYRGAVTAPPVEPDYLDPGAVNLDAVEAAPAAEAPEAGEAAPEAPPTLSLDDFNFESADPSAVNLEPAAGSGAGNNGHHAMSVPDLSTGSGDDAGPDPEAAGEESGESTEPVYDLSGAAEEPAEAGYGDLSLDGAGSGEGVPGGDDAAEHPGDAEAEQDTEPASMKARALEFLERNEPARAQRMMIRAGRIYFQRGHSHEAEDLYRRVVQMDPNHLEALRGLVELAHINGERGKMAHWGCELGDVLLAREMYGEAKLQFERVLAFDPENAKARSRVNRLNTIAGVEGVGYGELAPDASEVAGAQVTVKDEPSGEGQSAFDLSQILDEFRSAVVEQIPAGDTQSHYDMGMAYKEMGLLEEAAQAFETAAGGEAQATRSLEMLAECYLLLNRFEDSLGIYERLLSDAEGEAAARLRLQLGRVYEGLDEWDKAEDAYFQALELNEDLVEAVELLESMEQRRERGAA